MLDDFGPSVGYIPLGREKMIKVTNLRRTDDYFCCHHFSNSSQWVHTGDQTKRQLKRSRFYERTGTTQKDIQSQQTSLPESLSQFLTAPVYRFPPQVSSVAE
ncbi:MAG TPA: hypothetical protein VGQ09_21375 [Chitinophagaceae bacterium]|nr:hypothetical protein [Chitinophagaceae bacterium]